MQQQDGPVRLAVLGCGSRGQVYSTYALEHPDLAKVVAIAEPRDVVRKRMAEQHNIPDDAVFDGAPADEAHAQGEAQHAFALVGLCTW